MGAVKTVIIGASGMLGTDLCAAFPDAVRFTHDELDITDREQVLSVIKDLKPSLVINAAAYTNVDGCEADRQTAFEVNGKGPYYIAEACSRVGARMVHYSTDYVFDGSKKEYREDDVTRPINVYGESKLMGERSIAMALDDHIIIRTSWLFGLHGKNFVETMLKLSKEKEVVTVVDDQIGKPTYSADLAMKTIEVSKLSPGIYHITNDGVCSWYEFAGAIIPNVAPCKTKDYPRPAKRPACSVLVNSKTAPMRHWKEALAEYLRLRNGVNRT